MFEKVYEIINKIHENKEIVSAYKQEINSTKSGEEMVAIMTKYGNTPHVYKIENKILYDNARIELFREVMPSAVKIWNEYENKPYGEKTKARIKEKIKEATGCWFYAIWNQYGGDEFHFDVDYMTDGKLNYFFNSKDLEVISNPYGKKFLVYNKIQHVDFEELKLSYCNDYVDDPHQRAVELYDELHNLQVEFESLEERVHKLNYSLPSKCNMVSLGYPRWHDVA